MPRNALVVAAGAGLALLIAGIYGMSSLATMGWGLPAFLAGMFVLVSSTIILSMRLVNGSGPSTGMLGQMKSFLGTGNQELVGAGVPASAVITGMRDTGTAVNDQVVVAFDLLVQPQGGQPYPVSHRQILPRLLMGGVLPGRTVRVWSDPADPARIVIDWSVLPAQP
ncbi:hypothetical protein GCM10009530_66290 [Microbispora corallina]|uniref:Uncharacterized protein n=1 Tax=Microbispora corallina TaxID=83302 RepID=A0ABQ4G9C5_9ACTN|nr:hypothetical protein [Microbispora corallina]GIH43684.1 hypothetical protein Mco01_66840 [Microbispora corallina]